MHITHTALQQRREGEGNSTFLLSNKKGGYASFGNNAFSHFTGLFFFQTHKWTLYKTIDDIRLLDKSVDALQNNFHTVHRYADKSHESFFLFDMTLYFVVDDYTGRVALDLDMRLVYDAPVAGRFHTFEWDEDFLIITYKQCSDDSGRTVLDTKYLVIKGLTKEQCTLPDAWSRRSYSYDARRGEQAERWVYEALVFSVEENQRITCTFGSDKDAAIMKSHEDFALWDMTHQRLKRFTKSTKTNKRVAYSAATFALDALVHSLNSGINRTGVFAGFPWFFHFWARDELISLRALILAEKYSLVKDILFRYVETLQDDGRIPNMVPASTLGSSDAVGWLWKRLDDILLHLDKKGLLKEYFSKDELVALQEKLTLSLRNLQQHHFDERLGLITNSAQETWMDTHGGVGDVRDGARVETQALTLASLACLSRLARTTKTRVPADMKAFAKTLQKDAQKLVLDNLVYDGLFFSGERDGAVRPNVFIAYYVYPALFSKNVWKKTFDVSLEHLWLDWGGLASLSKHHSWFQPSYVAQDNKSYHRGDSWYWVNNLAALAMHDLDAQKFSFHVHRLTEASCSDLLWLGIIGHAAELSSASKQESVGCLAQAWSSATLIELLDRVEQ